LERQKGSCSVNSREVRWGRGGAQKHRLRPTACLPTDSFFVTFPPRGIPAALSIWRLWGTRTNVDAFVASIYESIGDPDALADMVRRFTVIGESRATQFGFLDRTGTWLQASIPDLDPTVLVDYLQHYVNHDPRHRFLFTQTCDPGRFHPCTEMVADYKAFDRTQFANELEKNGCRYLLATVFPVGPQILGGIGLMRAKRDGVYDSHDVTSMSRFLPHIQRASRIHFRMGRLESTLTSMEALFDRFSTPIVLTDRAGRLRHANAAGHEALRKATYLVVRNGHVGPACIRLSEQFDRLVSAAVSQELSKKVLDQGSVMRLLDANGRAAFLTVYSVRGQPKLVGMAQAEVAFCLTYVNATPAVDASRLQAAFGLTPAETRLADRLIRGQDLREIAEHLGLSRETIKTQLSSLFTKTATHRQAELVARLLSSVSVSTR